MAIVFDAASEENSSSVSPPFTWTHTVTAVGSGRILLVGASYYRNSGSPNIDSITYGGQSMTRVTGGKVGDTSTAIWAELWYIVSPPTGANTISISTTAINHISPMAVSYTGVDPANPFGTLVSATATNTASTISAVASSGAGELVVDIMANRNVGNETSISAGAGQTERVIEWSESGTGSERNCGGMSEEPGAGSVTMSWSKTSNGSNYAAMLAVPLKPLVDARGRLVHYFSSTHDPRRRIFDVQGRDTPIELLEIDRWIRSEGPYFPTPRKYASLVEDPAVHYMESILLTMGRVQIESLSETQLESLIRRLGGRGL